MLSRKVGLLYPARSGVWCEHLVVPPAAGEDQKICGSVTISESSAKAHIVHLPSYASCNGPRMLTAVGLAAQLRAERDALQRELDACSRVSAPWLVALWF